MCVCCVSLYFCGIFTRCWNIVRANTCGVRQSQRKLHENYYNCTRCEWFAANFSWEKLQQSDGWRNSSSISNDSGPMSTKHTKLENKEKKPFCSPIFLMSNHIFLGGFFFLLFISNKWWWKFILYLLTHSLTN